MKTLPWARSRQDLPERQPFLPFPSVTGFFLGWDYIEKSHLEAFKGLSTASSPAIISSEAEGYWNAQKATLSFVTGKIQRKGAPTWTLVWVSLSWFQMSSPPTATDPATTWGTWVALTCPFQGKAEHSGIFSSTESSSHKCIRDSLCFTLVYLRSTWSTELKQHWCSRPDQ